LIDKELLKIWLELKSPENRLNFIYFIIGSVLIVVIIHLDSRIEDLKIEIKEVRIEQNIKITECEAEKRAFYAAQILYFQKEKNDFLDLLAKYEKLKILVKNNEKDGG
jgi:hypothetical protein